MTKNLLTLCVKCYSTYIFSEAPELVRKGSEVVHYCFLSWSFGRYLVKQQVEQADAEVRWSLQDPWALPIMLDLHANWEKFVLTIDLKSNAKDLPQD